MIHDLEISMDIGFYKSHSIHHLYQHNEDFVRRCEMDIMNIIELSLSLFNYHKNALCYNVFNISTYSTMVEYPTKNTI